MKSLETLKEEILADGIIDAGEVAEIRSVIYADGTIDADEVDFLFELNDAVSGKNNDPGWKDLFVEAVTSNILADGEIDADEVALLTSKIQGDGSVDEVEKALLLNLKEKAPSFPAELAALL